MTSFLTADPPQVLADLRGPAHGERLGQNLKSLFSCVPAEPMPDRLTQLAMALEEAFQRGELFERRA